MSTTYVIGAGASKAVWDFPVMKGFLAECGDQLAKLRGGQERSDLEEYVLSRFGPLAEVNLEDVLTDLDNSLLGFGRMWYGSTAGLQAKLPQLRGELLEVVGQRLTGDPNRSPDKAGSSAYEAVLRGLADGDFIVTLNYDCGVEMFASFTGRTKPIPVKLVRIANEAGALLGDFNRPQVPLLIDDGLIPEAPVLLKLHGSVNYLACRNPSCPTRHHIYLTEWMRHRTSWCHTCGSDLEAVLIPPSMSKSFDRFPKLALYWRIAEHSLTRCDRIVVWGFSCPPTDHHIA